jgi:LacI family transcriptional regulator, sucrose operon repressor
LPDKKPTIKDIAAVARVSTQTISRVLNHRPDVAIATRERVLRTMAWLQYSPSVLARRMRWATINLVLWKIPRARMGLQKYARPLSVPVGKIFLTMKKSSGS